MIDGKVLIEKLLVYANENLDLKERDQFYIRNVLLREFRLTEPTTEKLDLEFVRKYEVPDELTKQIETYALENGIIEEGYENLYSTYIFGLITPMPSSVNKAFNAIKAKKGAKKKKIIFRGINFKKGLDFF